MEFKGTKGQWTNHTNEHGHITSVRSIQANRTIFTSKVNNMNESNANMILATFAPEILEMLQKLIVTFSGQDLELYQVTRLEEAEQLIKKATE